jgi:hypothetical protein
LLWPVAGAHRRAVQQGRAIRWLVGARGCRSFPSDVEDDERRAPSAALGTGWRRRQACGGRRRPLSRPCCSLKQEAMARGLRRCFHGLSQGSWVSTRAVGRRHGGPFPSGSSQPYRQVLAAPLSGLASVPSSALVSAESIQPARVAEQAHHGRLKSAEALCGPPEAIRASSARWELGRPVYRGVHRRMTAQAVALVEKRTRAGRRRRRPRGRRRRVRLGIRQEARCACPGLSSPARGTLLSGYRKTWSGGSAIG